MVRLSLFAAILLAALALAGSARAQLLAYDDAGDYLLSANWTNGANQGFGFTPWVMATNGPDYNGTFITTANNPMFVIASATNVAGVNYTNVWGVYANGTNGINETAAFRGFAAPVGTNTFKLQWGSQGAGVTTVNNLGQVHGWCGFTLRNGNATNSSSDFQTGALLYVYFLDGSVPSTLWFWDNNGVQSVPDTSFSDLGRGNITNAIEAEVTPGADGVSYHLILKDCVLNRTLFMTNGTFIGNNPSTVDSVALFCHETTGNQIYNRMQIAAPRLPPTLANLQPADGSIYLVASQTALSFEVDSFNSTIAPSLVNAYLNGVQQANLSFSSSSPASQLLVTCPTILAPDTFYTYTITAQDVNGNVMSNNYSFNTFLASDLYIDASDYNYNSGLFINSSTPANAYAGLLGSNGVDFVITNLAGTNNTYRLNDLPAVLSLPTDATGDPIDHANLRANGGTAYNLGYTDAGNWENYTRVVPAATNYSIYARAASGGGGQFEIEELVNSAATTSYQPFAALGRVNVPSTGGSEVYSGELTPLTDIFGNTVVVPLSGTKTLRCTAISSRGYNLEYLVVVAVTNATTTLRPYVATASPAPNTTGVSLASPVSFALANRQTTVNTSTIKLFVNSSNVTSSLVLSNNAAGTLATFTPTSNLPANSNSTVTVTFADSAGVNLTNSWTFVTAGVGGLPGNGTWSAGGGFDLNWSTAANWTGGTPGPGYTATFAGPGATATLVTNNIVSSNLTIQVLTYSTNNTGFHTTLIANGVTLTITNASTNATSALQVGQDNTFNKSVTNTITGLGGTLFIAGNDPRTGTNANQLNFQIRQCANPPAPEQTVLDMSGLGTCIATVGKFYVAQGGTSAGQSNVSARVNLARTNIITLLRNNAGQFEVGDSSGATNTLPGSTLNLGLTNAFFVDTARIGKNKATNNLMRFNPLFTNNNANPVFYMRGTNGPATRTTTWTIADADTEPTWPVWVSGTVDFSGGTLNASVNTLVLARGATNINDTGYAQGTLTFSAGTLNANNLTNGVQRAASAATATGIVNVSGTATLISTNIVLAQTSAGANPSLVTGVLNVTNGTVQANITAGGGASTVNVNGGTLMVSGAAGTPAARLSVLNLTSASLHLDADAKAATAIVNAIAVSASGTTITIDSVTNFTGPQTIHLISYTGANPYAGLSLAPLPAGYSGTLLNGSGSIDLSLSPSAPPPSPSMGQITVNGTQMVLSGTNNNGPGSGGTYRILTTTNLSTPLSNWTLLSTGSFDATGRLSYTNSVATNAQQFFRLQVP
jgi:hypothetical protein